MSTISASTLITTALQYTADTTGTLVFKTGATPTTALTLNADQSATFAGTVNFATAGFTNLSYTGTFTGGTGVIAIGTNQIYKDAAGLVGIGTATPASPLDVVSQASDAVGVALRGRSADNVASLRFYSNDRATFYSGLRSASDEFRVLTVTAIPITFYTTNTERMRIDSSGNVIVGNTSYVTAGVSTGVVASTALVVGGQAAGADAMYVRRGGSAITQFQTTNGGASAGTISLQPYGGSVGIGTDTPAAGSILNISTATSIASQFVINNTSYATGQVIGIDFNVAGGSRQSFIQAVVNNGTSAATDLLFGTASGGNNAAERMRIDSSGNVQIGGASTVAGSRLAVYRGADGGIAYFRNTSGTYQPAIYIKSTDASRVIGFDTDYATGGLDMNFSLGGSEVARFNLAGSLLIGLSTNNYSSTAVPKTVSYGGANTNNTIQTMPCGLALVNGVNANASGYGVSLKFHMSNGEPGKYAAIAGVADTIYANATALAFYTNPNGVSGADNNVQRMYIASNGSIGAPSGTNIYNASDARLKQNIVDLDNCLDKISKLRAVSYSWITDFCPVENDKTLYGFVAQEVEIVDNNLIEKFGNSDITIGDNVIKDPLRVNEKFIVPMLVKAIQELKAEFDEYKATHP